MLMIMNCSRKSPKVAKVVVEKERVKQPRIWEMGGNTRDLPSLDFSTDKDGDNPTEREINPDTQVCFLCTWVFICPYKGQANLYLK